MSILSIRPVAAFVLIVGVTLAGGGMVAAQQSRPGVRVVSSDIRSLVLDYTPSINFITLPNGTILPVVDGAGLLNAGQTGHPMLMQIPIPVALPSASGAFVEVISVEYAPAISGRVAPVPTMERGAEGVTSPVYSADPAAYSRVLTLPPVASLRYRGIARDVHIGSVIIVPYEANPLTNTIRPLKQIRLRLHYGPSAAITRTAAVGDRSVLVPASGLLNGDRIASWVVPVASARPRSLARRSDISSARAWMRVEVREDGLQQITADDFQRAGIDPATIDAGRIAVYGGSGADLPEQVFMADSNRMQSVPVIVEQDGGRISRVLFYGQGPTVWTYPASSSDTVVAHHTSPYVSVRSYIVAIEGESTRNFAFHTPPAGSATPVVFGNAHIVYQEERYNAVAIMGAGGSGRDWFAAQFQVEPSRQSDTRVFASQIPGLDRSRSVFYRVRVANATKSNGGLGTGTFTFNQNGNSLGVPLNIAGVGGETIALAASRLYAGSAAHVPGDNNSMLGITYTNRASGSGYLDWYEVHYRRSLNAENDRIVFDAPSGSGVAEFRVTGFSTDDILGFDVTDPTNPLLLSGSSSGGAFTFRDNLNAVRSGHRYVICARSAALGVLNPAKANFADLRNRSLDADILVIAHDDFRQAAEQYAAYRNAGGEFRAAVVTTSEIYTEYSSGNLDPTAIRDYVAHAVHSWGRKPTHVLLMGDGSYDYRMVATKQKPLVPPYESDDGDTYDHIGSTSFDDYYVRVIGDDPMVDAAIGRLPVETPEQASEMVAKIKSYEQGGSFGLWRQTIILAADDDYPLPDGGGFTGQSENLWRDLVPHYFEPRKIYLGNYPVSIAGARKFPAAAADLEQAVNRGALVTTWLGHGNPNVWAHESILEKDKFITGLANDSTLTYVPAVTCNFGYFDDPEIASGGELMVLQPNTGAIALMTATRAVYIMPNERLMRSHFRYLFKRDSVTRRYVTLGQALVLTKLDGSGDVSNDEKFFLIGDPAIRLQAPRDSVEVTRINTTDVATDTAVVAALSVVTIEGVVRNQFGSVREDFNGTAIVSLYDADRSVMVDAGTTKRAVTYYGGRLFRGPANVVAGRFTVTLRVPKDIAYDTGTGRVHVYAYNDQQDAAGMTTHVRIYGTDTTPITDHEGPDINIFMDDRTFASGDVVTPEPLLIVDLKDSNGINSAGSGLGRKIEAWFDGSPESVDLTDYYATLPTDYRTGSAERRIIDLEPGDHTVRVRAWDIFNNPSEATASFRIIADEENLAVVDIVNFPNPMQRETDFLFRHNQSRPLDVEVAIFTVSGRKIRTLEARAVTDRFVRVHWDGTDADGRGVANGVYLYRLRVNVAGEEDMSFETIEKVAVVR